MSNPYYSPTGNPTFGGPGASATIRAEFLLISAGFDKMPGLPLTAGAALIVNGAGTGFATTGALSLASAFTTTGAFTTTLVQGASVSLTLPIVSGTLATLAGVESLSNKTFVSPALGTPSSGVATNLTGTASGLTAGAVVTNANLTGPITSSGNATAVAAQTGTGSTFVMQTNPTLTTPVLGAATATSINGIGIAGTNGKTLTVQASLTLAGTDGKTLTVSNSLTLAGTDATVMTFPSTTDTVVTLGATQTLTAKTLTSPTLVTPALGTVASGNIAACTGWVTGTNGQTFLGSDVLLNNTGTVFDVVNTGSIGASGWVVEVEISGSGVNTGGAATIDIGIFNGASYLAVARLQTPSINLRVNGNISVIVTLSAATTFTFRAQDTVSTASVIATSGGSPFSLANKATYIKWKRLA